MWLTQIAIYFYFIFIQYIYCILCMSYAQRWKCICSISSLLTRVFFYFVKSVIIVMMWMIFSARLLFKIAPAWNNMLHHAFCRKDSLLCCCAVIQNLLKSAIWGSHKRQLHQPWHCWRQWHIKPLPIACSNSKLAKKLLNTLSIKCWNWRMGID